MSIDTKALRELTDSKQAGAVLVGVHALTRTLDRLAALEEQLRLANIDAANTEAERAELEERVEACSLRNSTDADRIAALEAENARLSKFVKHFHEGELATSISYGASPLCREVEQALAGDAV